MKKYFLWTMVVVLSLALVGCGGDKTKQANEKVLNIGTNATFTPFEFVDEKTKDYSGFDMDLIRAVAKEMGYVAKIHNIAFDGLIPSLDAGTINVIVSGMTITEERAKRIVFSEPYYKSGLSIMVKANNTAINSFEDLEGKKIAVQIGTVGAIHAKKIPNATVREFNSASETFMELKAGGVDVAINDLPVNQFYIKQMKEKDTKLVGSVVNVEGFGIAVAKKDAALMVEINKALVKLQQNGEYEKIYQKWFANN